MRHFWYTGLCFPKRSSTKAWHGLLRPCRNLCHVSVPKQFNCQTPPDSKLWHQTFGPSEIACLVLATKRFLHETPDGRSTRDIQVWIYYTFGLQRTSGTKSWYQFFRSSKKVGRRVWRPNGLALEIVYSPRYILYIYIYIYIYIISPLIYNPASYWFSTENSITFRHSGPQKSLRVLWTIIRKS